MYLLGLFGMIHARMRCANENNRITATYEYFSAACETRTGNEIGLAKLAAHCTIFPRTLAATSCSPRRQRYTVPKQPLPTVFSR